MAAVQRVDTPEGPGRLVEYRRESRLVAGRPSRTTWLTVELADGRRVRYASHVCTVHPPEPDVREGE